MAVKSSCEPGRVGVSVSAGCGLGGIEAAGETPLIECRTPRRVRGSATYRRKSDNLAGAVAPGWMTTDGRVGLPVVAAHAACHRLGRRTGGRSVTARSRHRPRKHLTARRR